MTSLSTIGFAMRTDPAVLAACSMARHGRHFRFGLHYSLFSVGKPHAVHRSVEAYLLKSLEIKAGKIRGQHQQTICPLY